MNGLSLSDYYLLMQMTGRMPGDGVAAAGKLGPVDMNISQAGNEKGGFTNVGLSAPIGDLPLRAGVLGQFMQGNGFSGQTIIPNISADIGPASLNYSRVETNNGGFDTVGGNLKTDFGNIGYNRSFGPSGANALTYSLPMDKGSFDASLTIPDKGKTMIGAGLTLQDFLG